MLDSGALISVVPSSVVHVNQFTGEHTVVLDANGGEARWPLADVWIHVGSTSSRQTVVVAPDESLGGKALLAINFHDCTELALVLEASSLVHKDCILLAETRRRVKSERVEEEEELRQAPPVCRPIVVGKQLAEVVGGEDVPVTMAAPHNTNIM